MDAAASSANAKCVRFYDKFDDAIGIPVWEGTRIWLNPPYSRKSKRMGSYGLRTWIAKAWQQATLYGKRVVLLLPGDTSTTYFHDYIYPLLRVDPESVKFLTGRVKFNGAKAGAKFGSIVAVFDGLTPSMELSEYIEEQAA